MRTLIEKVYMAKLAVLISIPKIVIIHWFASEEGGFLAAVRSLNVALKPGCGASKPAVHGFVLSEARTPLSRASCSRVMGIKEPKGVSKRMHAALK